MNNLKLNQMNKKRKNKKKERQIKKKGQEWKLMKQMSQQT